VIDFSAYRHVCVMPRQHLSMLLLFLVAFGCGAGQGTASGGTAGTSDSGSSGSIAATAGRGAVNDSVRTEAGQSGATSGAGARAVQPQQAAGSGGKPPNTAAGTAAPDAVGGSAGVAPAAGSGGRAAPMADGCTRALLQAAVDTYFAALAAHDPAALMLADGAKFTENGETMELGKAGLWLTAGPVRHTHSALDVEACTAATQAVVPDDGTDIPVALRLKLEQQKITEIETIAVRAGDFMLASNTSALSASAMTVRWEEPVPMDQRSSREQLVAWMTKYFRMFPRGVCNTTSACKRIENGGGSFDCSAGASCAAAEPGPSDNALEPRLILADVETGVGVGFTMFQANTDMHMFKMYGDEVHGVSAILGEADSSGWP
jgi:hypothetical protein